MISYIRHNGSLLICRRCSLCWSQVDDGLTWEVIPWLRSITALPIIIKGILSPRDAEIAMARGVDGIVVSNHGGRQLDGTPTALDALPAVLGVVRGRVPVS